MIAEGLDDGTDLLKRPVNVAKIGEEVRLGGSLRKSLGPTSGDPNLERLGKVHRVCLGNLRDRLEWDRNLDGLTLVLGSKDDLPDRLDPLVPPGRSVSVESVRPAVRQESDRPFIDGLALNRVLEIDVAVGEIRILQAQATNKSVEGSRTM